MDIVDSMNESLIVGMLHPELQDIVNDYFDMLAKIVNGHQDKWNKKSIDIFDKITEETKQMPDRELVITMMFKSLQFDLNEKMKESIEVNNIEEN